MTAHAEVIDITPTWQGILPALLAANENGTVEGRRIAHEELSRMAKLADLYVAMTTNAAPRQHRPMGEVIAETEETMRKQGYNPNGSKIEEPTHRTIDAFTAKLESFVAGCQKIIREANVKDTLTIDPQGRKFIRIVTNYGGNHSGTQRSVFCFVDRETGDVLKADGWKRPAKHARGNIYDETNGLARIKWTGPEYLK